MDLDAISVFVKVVEVGSFSGAARLLDMPKTTVSAKVAALERKLGVTLIQRTTRRLHVTEAGQTYFRHCAIAIKEIEAGEDALQAGVDKPKGLLRISTAADVGHYILPKLVTAYLQKYPGMEVDLIVTNRRVDLIAEGIDLAIRGGELKDSTLMAKKYAPIHGGFWSAPSALKKWGTPAHPRDLARLPLIMHPALGRSFEVSDGKSTLPLSMGGNIKADDFETIKGLLVLGQGVGWLPRFLVANELKTKTLLHVLPRWDMQRIAHFSFVYPAQKYSSPRVRTFIETAMGLPLP